MSDTLTLAQKLEKGRYDVYYFAKELLGITLHPGQKRMAEAYLKRTKSRWRALYLWICVAAGNRAGKTLALAIIILHSCVYRMGLKPPDDPNDPDEVRHWQIMPYHWWHFAVEQGPAEQVFTEIVTILSGTHFAQKKGCPWAIWMGEGDAVKGARMIATATTTEGIEWTNGSKERGEYAWITMSPTFGGAQVHFRSTKAKALSAVGQNMHGLSFDEAGLETQLYYLLNDIMHNRRLGTGGQFILIGTASIATSGDFADLWVEGDPEDPFQKPRRFSMRMSSRENVGHGLDKESFDALIEGMPEDWIKQNIDGLFIQSIHAWFHEPSINAAFRAELPESEEAIAGQIYLHSLDPGLGDKCWSLVFRVTKDRRAIGVSIERQFGKQTTRGIIALGVRQHRRYAITHGDRTCKQPRTETRFTDDDKPKEVEHDHASCNTGVDTTSLGGHMFRDLIEEEIPAITSVEFGGNIKKKRQMLSDLKTAIDEGRIWFPEDGFWREVRTQLKNYRLLDRKQEQDLVMGLCIIAKALRTTALPGVVVESAFEFGVEADPGAADDRRQAIDSKNLRAALRRRSLARREAEARPPRETALERLNRKRALVGDTLTAVVGRE